MSSFVQKWAGDLIKLDDFNTEEKRKKQQSEGERCIFLPPTIIIHWFFRTAGSIKIIFLFITTTIILAFASSKFINGKDQGTALFFCLIIFFF